MNEHVGTLLIARSLGDAVTNHRVGVGYATDSLMLVSIDLAKTSNVDHIGLLEGERALGISHSEANWGSEGAGMRECIEVVQEVPPRSRNLPTRAWLV